MALPTALLRGHQITIFKFPSPTGPQAELAGQEAGHLKCSTVNEKKKLQDDKSHWLDFVDQASLPVDLNSVGSGPGLSRGCWVSRDAPTALRPHRWLTRGAQAPTHPGTLAAERQIGLPHVAMARTALSTRRVFSSAPLAKPWGQLTENQHRQARGRLQEIRPPGALGCAQSQGWPRGGTTGPSREPCPDVPCVSAAAVEAGLPARGDVIVRLPEACAWRLRGRLRVQVRSGRGRAWRRSDWGGPGGGGGGAARDGMLAGWGAGSAQGLIIAGVPWRARGPSGRAPPPVLEASFPPPASWGRSRWRPCLSQWRPPIACTGGRELGGVGHGWEGASACFGPRVCACVSLTFPLPPVYSPTPLLDVPDCCSQRKRGPCSFLRGLFGLSPESQVLC